jgi:ADP-heptose:LPS heptosyltransferase
VRENRGAILVVRGGAIGDFILTLPVLSALRRQFAEARLEVLGYPHIARLALLGGLADAVHSIEARPLAGFFAPGGGLDPALADYFARFALVVSYLYDPDGVFRDNVGRCSRAQFIAGPHRPDESRGVHATEVFLEPLQRLAIFDADPVPRLPVARPAGSGGGVLLALHPGSGSEKKNWPEDRWRELLVRLGRETDWDFLVVGGEAEGPRLERLAAQIPPDRRQLARSLPLPELAGRLAACSAFIGHDSGITHLAAALGLPGLALWGDTLAAVWRPRSDGIRLVRAAGGLDTLTADGVVQELLALVGLRR